MTLDDPFNRFYVIDGELCDTREGYTYIYVWYCVGKGGKTYFSQCLGARPTDITEITDSFDIEYYNTLNPL
jgi:hypothetical protein